MLTTVLAVFSVFLTTFVGLPQRFGDMVKAVIQVILELAIAEDRQALRRRVSDDRNLSPDMRKKIHDILNLPFETSSSRFRKNVKTLYAQLDIDPSMVIHPKCPTKECQNVFIDVVDKDGWDKVPDNCPECGTALREDGMLVTEFFPRRTLQAELEYLFSLDGVERLVEDQQILPFRQRQRDTQMEGPAYLREANPGRFSATSWTDHATRSIITMSSANVAVWSLPLTSLSTGQTPRSPAIVLFDPWALLCVS